ncbi:MAG: acyl-CoA thioesterase [Bacteroidia bacterium]|nr:acyl-CoA thioesterase [Bacteroidia bacterium]
MTISKTPKESFTIMNELVLPNDTNALGNMFGGRLLQWMDVVAAICAQKHSNSNVVTASVDGVSFKEAIHLGNVVTLEAYVSRAFSSSMEIYIKVYAHNIPRGEKYLCNDAYYTFVAIDSRSKAVSVPATIPETEEEINKFEGALRRRQVRLVMAGKMKPEDASELKALFVVD